MIRAIFFDFYGVWAPDTIQALLNEATALGPQESAELESMVDHYFHGGVGVVNLYETFRWRLGRPDVEEATFALRESNTISGTVNYMRSLHGHFLKLGILANLGTMELNFINGFNATQSLFETIVSPLSLGTGQPLLSREVFGNALKAIGEQPATCVAVSAHPEYLAFATSLGMQTVPFASMASLSGTLEQLLAKDMPNYVNPSR